MDVALQGIAGGAEQIREVVPREEAGIEEKQGRHSCGGRSEDAAKDDGEKDGGDEWIEDEPERAEHRLFEARGEIALDELPEQVAVGVQVAPFDGEPPAIWANE